LLVVTHSPAFDPTAIAVVRTDSDLPKLPTEELGAQALRQRFAMQPAAFLAQEEEAHPAAKSPVRASVLVPLIQRDRLTVLFTLRSPHLSSHSGQISFPGGKADAHDSDAVATALREAHEEVGLESRFIDVLGTLPRYQSGSGYIITPVVALMRPGFAIHANHHEVAEVFEVPLEFLMNPANHRHHRHLWMGLERQWLSMPYQDDGPERFIWGVTAALLRNFYHFLRQQ
jgi:8-oxo-dGTP pyrophosphatase MutT (NUDIX family)